MKIGVDLRALQVGHQYRGIGEVVKRTLDEMFRMAVVDENEFIFYVYEDMESPLQMLHIPGQLQFSVISVGHSPIKAKRTKGRQLSDALAILYGNPIKSANECDVFLQYDYALGVPTNTKTLLIKHDIIPFIFWDQFFESPLAPFKNKAARTTIRTIYDNYKSKRVLLRALSTATKIITVSEHTRQDLHKYFKVSLKKMETIHLGASIKAAKNANDVDKQALPTKPYLLFIGAVDKRRRRIDDLIAAFNNLKADGHDIQLALVGENFRSPQSIPEGPVRSAVQYSSYKEDILTMGYVDDATKLHLFGNAIAFVFPSKYEGFGIPVLEAMLLECPVIAYSNSSIPEVGGEHVFYARDWTDIKHEVEGLLSFPENDRKLRLAAAKVHAEAFNWVRTGKALYDQLKRL